MGQVVGTVGEDQEVGLAGAVFLEKRGGRDGENNASNYQTFVLLF